MILLFVSDVDNVLLANDVRHPLQPGVEIVYKSMVKLILQVLSSRPTQLLNLLRYGALVFGSSVEPTSQYSLWSKLLVMCQTS